MNIEIPYDPAIPLLGVSKATEKQGLEQTLVYQFIVALFTIAKG